MTSIKSTLHRSFRQPRRQNIDYPTDLRELVAGDGQASVNAVLIHDVTIGRDAAWQQASANNGWCQLLTAASRQSRIFAYSYNTNKMTKLSHILNPETIEKHAEDLLDRLRAKLGNQRAPNESSAAEADAETPSDESLVPLIVVAHGYGGLIYERALLSSRSAEENFLTSRFQLAFLLGTPHYDAGLGEWAIMCAKKLNIRCASNAQSQNWSNDLKEYVTSTRKDQKKLRDILREEDDSHPMIKVVGCFASRPIPGSKLIMSPEWAVMPEFTPISINTDHFGLTDLSGQGPDLKKVRAILESWYERIHNADATQEALPKASSSRPILDPISISRMFVQPIRIGTFHNPKYLPQFSFAQFLLSEVVDATIQSWLGNTVTDSIPSLVEYSIQNPRTFLTLASTNLIAKLPLLHSSNFTDQCLPIEVSHESNDQSKFKVYPVPNSDSDPPSQVIRRLECFDESEDNEKGWTFADVDRFVSKQWTFLVANFENAEFGFAVDWETPLPYVELAAESADNRNPVNILRLGLQEENLVATMEANGYLRKDSQSSTPLPEIAVKHIRIPDATQSAQLRFFHNEVHILKTMRDLGDEHLIQAVSAYTKGDEKGREQFLVLPWASMGNLRDFWCRNSDPPSLEAREWASSQIDELAQGLLMLHGKGIGHGGLKPENILIFESGPESQFGRLVIADVGLSLFYAEETTLRQSPEYLLTIAKLGALRYQPPEFGFSKQPLHISSQGYDSWSLGCIVFEFSVWLCYGSDGQNQFHKEILEVEPGLERFWSQGSDESPVLHPTVYKWLKKMHHEEGEQTSLGLVEMYLLVPSPELRKGVSEFSRLKTASSL